MSDALPPKPRWYYFTLRRVLFLLLAVETSLLVLGRCRWFGLIEHEIEGLTFVIGLLAVVVAVALGLIWFLVGLCVRRGARYSICVLLLLTGLVGIAVGWFWAERWFVAREREAAEAMEALGGHVRWDGVWTSEESVFSRVTNVSFEGRVTDAALQHLNGFAHLSLVTLKGTDITDAGLHRLSGLQRLNWLDLEGTNITDAGLQPVEPLRNLEWLNLERTRITDDGLRHLEKLTRLRGLNLNGTQITDAGLRHLQDLPCLDGLYVGGTRVTDAGLETLKKMPGLLWLNLAHTQTTNEGVEKLRQALPHCQVSR